jgi:protein-S-isoprenylcysteine O-methyltransferase Ste14
MEIKVVLQRVRVPLGFLCAALFCLVSRPTLRFMAWGLPLVLAGLALRIWSAGHIRKGREIARSGPYSFTRNPLYLGSFLIGIGFAVQSGIWLLVPFFALVFLLIYLPVMRQEERELESVHGGQYLDYRRRVPLFIPTRWPDMRPRQRFSVELAWRNREYNAPVGALLAELLLLVKVFYPFP